MQLPPDIISAILDTFALPYDDAGIISVLRDPHVIDTLRACALTSRSFLSRSQLHLFSAITCNSHSHLVKLDQLLSTSPHIGALYVRYFTLRITPTVELGAECAILTARVLPILTNLAHLALTPPKTGAGEVQWITQDVLWETQPIFLKAAFQTALVRPSLRSLSLSRYSFANVASLEHSLLRHAKSVKRLSLMQVIFHDDTSFGRDSRHIQADDGPTVLLEHLTLTHITKDAVDAMLSGLRAVDIKHLRSLGINQRSIPLLLLKANAQTLQKILYLHPDSRENPDPVDPDILAGKESLHAIEITQNPHRMAYTLGELGNLRNLKAPNIVITLSFLDYNGMGVDDANRDLVRWPKLDMMLRQAGDRLAEVRIRIPWPPLRLPAPPDLETRIQGLLPSVVEIFSVHLGLR
ncbi:hypothetical protein C8J57DRAFT_1612701 [Mycena rebaudengoi]|nr:hypothetical protein C8J57DRAFT_1612701 [Mycena rebaudengoi]